MQNIIKNSNCNYYYITDDTSPNPYDTLPTYWQNEQIEVNNSISYFNLDLKRDIYIWSSGFKNNNKYISDILATQKIDTSILSIPYDANKTKVEEFLKKHKTTILIGDNKWIYEDERSKIDDKLNFLNQFKNYYIHLDIEPHTLDDLKDDRDKYLQMYIDMLEYIHSNYPKYQIDISIPTFYDIKYVTKMAKYVNNIYLMAYEYKNIDNLIDRVNKYKSLKDKIIVAFNAKDYPTKNALFNDIKEFTLKSGYSKIAIHSLRYFLKLN